MNSIFRTISTLVFVFSSTVAMADVAIISNPDNKIGKIDSFIVKNIFLGERASFPNGVYANPVNLAEGSQARKVFFHTILSISEQVHDKHWARKQKKRTMRTTAYRPEEVDSNQEMMEIVADTSGSIGYVDASMVNDTVKVLLIIKTNSASLEGKVVANK